MEGVAKEVGPSLISTLLCRTVGILDVFIMWHIYFSNCLQFISNYSSLIRGQLCNYQEPIVLLSVEWDFVRNKYPGNQFMLPNQYHRQSKSNSNIQSLQNHFKRWLAIGLPYQNIIYLLNQLFPASSESFKETSQVVL